MIRKIIAAVFVLSLSAGAVAAQTTCATLPHALTNGQPADANQVMANLNSVRDCVNTVALLPAMTVQVFTASGTYMRTSANVKSVLVYAKGGGGSGGGGGGEDAESWKLLTGAAATGQAVTVAAGGAAVASNTAGEGNAGGTSSLGSLITAPGGGGGTTTTASGAGASGIVVVIEMY